MMSIRTMKDRVKYLEGIGVLISANFNKVYETSEGDIHERGRQNGTG